MLNSLMLAVLALGLPPLEDGSLIYLENSNKVVGAITDSDITHVGILINYPKGPVVYEATPGHVRRLPLTKYFTEIAELNHGRRDAMKVWIIRPTFTYREGDVAAMRKHLESQLGRRYSVRGYVRGSPGDGVHCAELTATTLSKSERVAVSDAHRTNPSQLVQALQPHYTRPVEVSIRPRKPQGSWCERSWSDWTRRWSWCKWSCEETWTFCW